MALNQNAAGAVVPKELFTAADEQWMQQALQEAQKASSLGEVPVGAVLIDHQGQLLARAHNRRELDADPLAHAELLVVKQATGPGFPGLWRLPPATLYVTLEPCIMCMGVLLQARLERLVFATTDPKGGAAETLYQLGADPRLNHRIQVQSGLLREPAAEQLRDFFRQVRRQRAVEPRKP